MIRLTPRRRLALALLLGVVAALGLAPFEVWPATVLGLAGFGWLVTGIERPRAGFWTGWAFGFGYFAFGLIWLVEPFMVDPARDGWLAPFAIFFMDGGLALFWGAATLAACWLARGPASRVTALAVTWTLAELGRGYLFTGFPWAAPGQVWIDTPVAQLLYWVGPAGLNLATFAATLPLALLVVARRRRLLALLPAVAVAVATVLAAPRPTTAPDTPAKTVRVVQPNAEQRLKWDPAYVPIFFQRQLDYTAAEPRPDLVVWPEVAAPNYIEGVDDPLGEIVAAAQGTPVALGVLRPDEAGYYNSLAVIDAEGRVSDLYDKHHLVPFGEYLPYSALLSRLGLGALASVVPGDMASGPGPRLVVLPGIGRALPLICYEAVFPQDVNNAPSRPDLLLQITNDAWFGTFSGPYQHLAQARMRAIEQGLPMVRSANTGISGVIDPYGRVVDSLPLGQPGYLDVTLPLPRVPGLYARTGDWPAFLLSLVLLAGLVFHKLNSRRTKND